MQFADEHGIMVIDECSSVDTEYGYSHRLVNYKNQIFYLIFLLTEITHQRYWININRQWNSLFIEIRIIPA